MTPLDWVLIVQLFSMRGVSTIDIASEAACTKAGQSLLLTEQYEPRGRAWCVNKTDGRVVPISIVGLRAK